MNNFSTTGYKDNSPDKNKSHNVIPGNLITMKGVSKKLALIPIIGGKPRYDQQVVANPGDDDIQFGPEVESVLELPYAQSGMMTPGQYENPYVQYYMDNNPMGVQTVTPSGVPNIPPMVNVRPPSVEQYGNQQINQQLADGVAPQGPSAYNPSLYSTQSTTSALSSGVDPNEAQKVQAEQVKSSSGQNKPFMGAINPYGGWNMHTAATALGASIEAKNPLGIIGSAGKILLEGTRNAMSGASAYKVYKEGKEEYESDMERAERRQGLFWGQKGGKIGRMLTGNFIEGNPDHSDPNVEVEKGEYLQTPEGSTMEVLGNKHSDGGELLNMPGGTKVISDYLKIGAKLASFFKKEFDLNVRSGSSFATVLDQYKKKIGLTKLLEEEADVMGKIADQEKVKFEGSRELNLQVLSEKAKDLQPQKKELEQRFEVFTNLVFDKQEQTKEPGQNNFEKQEGGEIEEEQLSTEDGQPIPQEGQAQQEGSEIEQIILAYSQVSGQDPQQIIEQLQQLPEDQLEAAVQQMMQAVEQGMSQEQAPQEGQQAPQEAMMRRGGGIEYAQVGKKTRSEFDEYLGKYTWDPTYEYGNLEEQAKAIVPFLERNGIAYDPADLKTQAGMDALAGKAQQAFRTGYQDVSNHYSSNVAPTQTGLQTALDNKLISETELKNLGVKVSNGKILRGAKGIVPKSNEQKVTDIITKNGTDNKDGYKKYVDTNFVDNKWYFRNPDVQTVTFDTQEELDDYTGKFKTTFDKDGKKIYYSDKQGLYFTPELAGSKATPDSTGTSKVDATSDLVPPGNTARDYQNGLPLLTPDQSNLPPTLLQPGLRQVGHVQANAIRISPEETLKELNRQYNTASDAIMENNPYTAGAAQANLQAQTNNSINQAYSQAAIVNAQDERNVANTNEQRIQQRDQVNMGMLDNYEKLSQAALDNYTTSWRNFIDKKNLENVNNFNLQQQVNASNAVNPNYQIGAHGQIYQTEEPQIFYVNGVPMAKDPRTGQEYELIKKTDNQGNITTTEKSTTYDNTKKVKDKKEKGGLVLSQSIKRWLK